MGHHFRTLALHDNSAVNLDKHSDQTLIRKIKRGFRRSQGQFSRG
jgi:antitoxin component of MazEF toxin-antitoxin module